MNARFSFRKTDVVAALLCSALLFLSLGAVGSTGRRRAKEAVCLANLHQWGIIFYNRTLDNNGQFFQPFHASGYWWPAQLDQEHKDWKKNRRWFCPEAEKPAYDENGQSTRARVPFAAWGIYRSGPVDLGENGISGSYGINGYVIPIQGPSYEGGRPASDGWKTPNVAQAATVPVFFDALRFDLWPLETDAPARVEFENWTANNMARCVINRHHGAVNTLFLDFSARKVGLKALWTLDWHRSFNTAGPWTQAGGAQPYDWPAWMREFRDY